jgi:NADPH-dependent 2,4-dienoyl-CoA reductase/sulfur reductase-like enzyme
MYDPRTMEYIIQPSTIRRATNVHLAQRFKQELRIPVTAVGSFNMELAEEALASGKADLVAMIRAFIAEPELVNKARRGKADEIRPCIRCNVCTGDDPHGCPKPLRCTVNPISGRSPLFDVIPRTETPKKVVIIGGGCAGMEAARRLCQRGHIPVLFEKEPQLGGSLTLAGANQIKSDVQSYAEWSVRMTERTKGIRLRRGTAATRELVLAEKPDALVIAVGSEQILPEVPGITGGHVALAVDLDTGKVKAGNAVVVIGAGLTGSETAVALADNGHQVTLVDMLPLEKLLGQDKNLARIHRMARERGIEIRDQLRLTEIREGCAVVTDKTGARIELKCDTVALSLGVRPREGMVTQFMGLCDETYIIGDCANKAGNITSAVREGFYAAMNIE